MANFIRHCCTKNSTNFTIMKSVLPSIFKSTRTFSSALYVPGNKANQTFAHLHPDIDFNDRFADIDKLEKELNQRNVKIDARELHKTWEYYQYMNSNRQALEEKLGQVNGELSKTYKIANPSEDQLKQKEHFQNQNKLIKQDLKAIKEAIWELEASVIPQVLKLPNETDERTPVDGSILLKSIGEKPSIADDKKQSHLDIGKKLGLLEYQNPVQYYLCDKSAFFELEALALAGKILEESSFMRVAGPDFCRSILVEGCGLDHENFRESFILQNDDDDVKEDYLVNRLHLVGGASLPALLAIYTKQAFKPYEFPLRIFTSGRHYTPCTTTPTTQGLFSVCQASAVQALTFVERKESDEYNTEFEKLIETASRIYDEIGCHYRLVVKPAKELSSAESMRVSFEMWSVHAGQYVEVGHVSACGDYFSKRLMIACPTKKSLNYPAAVTGTLLSVPRVLACLIEENPDEFVMPDKLRGFFE